MLGKLLFGIYVIYCFEVGIFLIIFPWMDFWRHNLLLQYYPALQFLFLNNFFRGAVTGLGMVNLILGGLEIVNYRRRSARKAGA